MTVLIVIAAILAFLLVLLIVPISVQMSYEDEFSVTVKYAGIRVFKSGGKSQKNKPEKAEMKPARDSQKSKKSKPKKPNFISRVFKEKGKIAGIKYCFNLIKIAFSRIIWVIKKIEFKSFYLDITVSSEDAANTAIEYGALCAVVYPTISFIGQNTKFGVKEVNIRTDFDKLSPIINASVLAKTRLIYAVVAAISFLIALKGSEKNERK